MCKYYDSLYKILRNHEFHAKKIIASAPLSMMIIYLHLKRERHSIQHLAVVKYIILHKHNYYLL